MTDKLELKSSYEVVVPVSKDLEEAAEIFSCKHQGQLVNQGYTFCYAGHDPSKCNECEFREPEHIVTKFTTTSYETKPEKFVRKERRIEQ